MKPGPMKIMRWTADLALAAATVYMLGLIGAAAIESANKRAGIRIVSNEARSIYESLHRYYQRNRAYPNAYAEPGFELDTFEPLRRRGYYTGQVTQHLALGRIDAYDSPDDQGLNREFWIEMTLRQDPSIRFLVASSDDAPLGGGAWHDGAFIYRDGKLEPL